MYEQARYELEVKVATSIKVAYGPVEVSAAAEYGAVEYLLVAGRAGKKLAAMVRSAGGTVFEVDEQHSPAEHTFLNTFTGLVALLRFAVPEDAACMLAAEAEAEAEADAANFRRTRTSTRAKTQARAFTTTAKAERAEEDEDEVLEHLNAAMWHSTVAFQWTEGDVLCCDNERAMHARTSFENFPQSSGKPPRQILVGLSKK